MAKTKEGKAVLNKAWHEAHRKERAAYHKAYHEAHHEEQCARKRGYYATHKEEAAIYHRAWRESHLEKRAAYNRAYRESHLEEEKARDKIYREAHHEKDAEESRRRQALKRGALVGPIDLETIRVRDRMLCCICGKRVTEKDLSFDHTIPLSLGGPHSQENLRVAHRRCNSRRGAGRLPVQMVLC